MLDTRWLAWDDGDINCGDDIVARGLWAWYELPVLVFLREFRSLQMTEVPSARPFPRAKLHSRVSLSPLLLEFTCSSSHTTNHQTYSTWSNDTSPAPADVDIPAPTRTLRRHHRLVGATFDLERKARSGSLSRWRQNEPILP